MLLSTEAELQMHLVELGEHMDDPGELQPEGGGQKMELTGGRADICSEVMRFHTFAA